MRVERIQPENVKADGAAGVQEEQKVLRQFMSPLGAVEQERREAKKEELSRKELLGMLEEKTGQLNRALEIFNKRLRFEVHDETERIMVKILEKRVDNTDEVIREIPPERVLDMLARIEEMIGLLIDERI
ncbi:MAG TPA: flagellar protein FlaG [Firmicutes bacterium]|nr:flagellar protein FlaG [Bacillota bacterium]